MSNIIQNIVVLAVCWLLVTGAGIYVTYFDQPAELERLEKAEKVARLKKAEVAALLAEEAATKQKAEEVVRRWRARYKVIPQKLEDEDVVAYLNHLSREGFKNFDITFQGEKRTYQVTGRGYFDDLYRVVWMLENSRNFYRVGELRLNHIDLMTKDPETEQDALQIMVSFNMEVIAYFGGAKGLSAESVMESLYENGELGSGPMSALPPVPAEVLPDPTPAKNPFFPIIMERIPPNTHNLVDLEKATLVSIVGGKAVFEWKNEYHQLDVGDRVYLGQIIAVDPTRDRVVARLNKGGIIDEIEMSLQTGERYRQALGPINLTPVQEQ